MRYRGRGYGSVALVKVRYSLTWMFGVVFLANTNCASHSAKPTLNSIKCNALSVDTTNGYGKCVSSTDGTLNI